MHFVSCTFYFRYTSGHCLIDIVSPFWGCLSRRQLFSYGNSEVNAFSLCVHFVNCAFYFRYTSGHCLIDIVSLLWGCLSCRQLFSHGNSEVMHSACVCILSVVLFISDTLLVIVSSTLFLRFGGVCLVDNYSAMETVG